MSLVGLICNRFSDGNGGQTPLADFAAGLDDVVVRTPASPAELAAALAEFARRRVAVVAVDGGDGTLREVLTALPEAFDGACPPVALLPSGKTNLAVADVGSFGGGAEGLTRLRASARAGWRGARWSERPVLEVTWQGDPKQDGPGRKLRGIVFGAGIFTHATRMAGRWAHDRGLRRQAAVAVSMAWAFLHALRGKGPLPVHGLRLGIDGQPAGAAAPSFLVLATTAQRLMLGFWPFPPPAAGCLHWLEVAHPPRRLAWALWQARRGRLRLDGGDYRGGHARQLTLALCTPFVVDGEVYLPGPGGVTLCTGPTIRFVSG